MKTTRIVLIGVLIVSVCFTALFFFQSFSGKKHAVQDAILKEQIKFYQAERAQMQQDRRDLQNVIRQLDIQIFNYQKIDSSLIVAIDKQKQTLKLIDQKYDKKVAIISTYNSADIKREFSKFD